MTVEPKRLTKWDALNILRELDSIEGVLRSSLVPTPLGDLGVKYVVAARSKLLSVVVSDVEVEQIAGPARVSPPVNVSEPGEAAGSAPGAFRKFVPGSPDSQKADVL